MLDWLHMGGYGFYVWSSYGMLALAIAIELHALRRHRRAARRRAEELRAEQAAHAAPLRETNG
ncbi:MAG TPA: heme exporter protein CcmD [Zeimonas sp.]|nr:heme exporter protein CcmD [Zeimonas sp.]